MDRHPVAVYTASLLRGEVKYKAILAVWGYLNSLTLM